MKVKITVPLSPDLILSIDEIAEDGSSRSQVIEQPVREFLKRLQRQRREARDLEILNRHADDLNREMEDVLSYQAEFCPK